MVQIIRKSQKKYVQGRVLKIHEAPFKYYRKLATPSVTKRICPRAFLKNLKKKNIIYYNSLTIYLKNPSVIEYFYKIIK